MAIVSRFSVEKVVSNLYVFHRLLNLIQAASVKKAVKRGLTQRLRERVGMGDSDSSDEEKDSSKKGDDGDEATEDGTSTLRDDGLLEKDFAVERTNTKPDGGSKRGGFRGRIKTGRKAGRDIEMGQIDEEKTTDGRKSRRTSFQLPKAAASMASMSMLEQSMPADAVLAKEGAEEVIMSCFFDQLF